MSKVDSKTAGAELDAALVADYLRRHPEFLSDQPGLLTELEIPHTTPAGVSSLIERQVDRLRNENRHYRQQLDRLSRSQRDLQALSSQVHQLVVALLTAAQPDAVCEFLQDCLHHGYDADAARLFLFLDHNPFQNRPLIEVRGRNDKLRLLLAELFNRGQPLLDSLQAEHLPLMFDRAAAADMHASILLPITGHQWDGLLAIGSRERDRYRRGPELELLVFLARVTAIQLDRWLEA